MSASQLMIVVLNAGDCGSWVVDESTCEVYGHVVASDAMGDTYVVPLNATLRDMEEKLAAAVVLPTEADIHTWLAQHTKAAEQTAVPTASKKKKVVFNDSETERVAFIPRDVRKLVDQSSSRASASLTPPAVKASIQIVDYCNLCDAKFEGSSQDVSSSLLRHRQNCSKQNKHPKSGIESSTSQRVESSSDESSKSSSVKDTRNVQQKATSHTSMQQLSPVPWSIRSTYTSTGKTSGLSSQQKDKGKVKSVSNSGEEKTAGSTSSTKEVTTTSPTSTAKDSKKSTRDSNIRKDWPSPPLSRRFPNPSPALAGSIRGDPSSPPPATLTLPHIRQDEKTLAPPLPRPASPRIDSYDSHQNSSDRRHQSHTTNSGEVSYEGYTFYRCKSHHKGQKETWAVAQMVPMPVSQEDLKDQIKKGRKKQVSALDEYNDDRMKGFKRKQVDNLIRECTKIDGRYGYEYVLASIKLDLRNPRSKITETLSMQVILKRQPRAGFLHKTSAEPSLDVQARLLSQVMDLTREDELGLLREHGSGSQDVGHWGANVPFSGHPEHGQSFGHSVPFVDNRPPIFEAVPLSLCSAYVPPQGIRQPPPSPPRPAHSIPLIHHQMISEQRHPEKVNKSKQKKTPKIVYAERHFASSSSSLSDHSIGLYSDTSWAKTDATPASTASTASTRHSSQSQESRKEKKIQKDSKGGSHNKDKFIPTPLAHEIERPVYREHRRREHRRSSISPFRRPRDVSLDRFDPDFERRDRRAAYPRNSSGARFRDFGHYEIEPAVSFPADRSSRHRRSSISPERFTVSPERPSHRRVSSYDVGDPHAHDSRALIPKHRRPTVYQEPPRGFPHGIYRYEHAAERQREIERQDREWDQRVSEEFERLERQERHTREKKRETERQGDLESTREMEGMKEMERRERARMERG